MSTWIIITADQLNDYSVAAKVNALRTAALKAGQADPFDAVMPDVVAAVRMQIQSCASNQVSATANSIPPELKSHVCWLIIQAMQARLPGLKLSDEEKDMVKKADRYMEKVASCEYKVSAPEEASDEVVQAGTSPAITPRTKRFERCDQDGI